MISPPGTGKTILARRLPTILPPLSLQESLETTRVYSAVGKRSAGSSLVATRPVRQPHHSISIPALVRGGTIPSSGEHQLIEVAFPKRDDIGLKLERGEVVGMALYVTLPSGGLISVFEPYAMFDSVLTARVGTRRDRRP